MTNRIFITGTNTNSGKTYFAIHLIKSLIDRGFTVKALKPIASDANWINGSLKNDDALSLIEASNIKLPYEIVNPYCFEPPIAPHIAASQKHINLSVKKIAQHICTVDQNFPSDFTIIEGVGGWLVPLNHFETMGDLVKAVDAKAILVISITLGCLNHALLTVKAIQSKGVTLEGWIANCNDLHMLNPNENIETLKQWLDVPLLHKLKYSALP